MAKSEALYIEYGATRIPFFLQYSNRKTLGIVVTPDKKVTITAPVNAGLEKILQKIGNKASWISKQIRKFDSYAKGLMRRCPEYISGETFYYLGRKYRLKVIDGNEKEVNLSGKFLRVTVKQKADQKGIAALIRDWYKKKAKEVFKERFERFLYILKREKIEVNQLLIRSLEKRWGSCTEKGNIVLNLSLIQAPVQCIDYVVVHEICHLKYMNHSPKFYRLLGKYVEDWEKRKSRLEDIKIF